jgi:hypothetical protein
MRRTSVTDVLGPFLIVGALAYALLRANYDSLPPFQWYAAVPLVALAVVEVSLARRIRAAVRHLPGSRAMSAFAVARSVALGKASGLVGAAVAGAAVALILTVLPDRSRTPAAEHDFVIGIILLVAAAAVTVSGLLLEQSGIDPNSDVGER